VAALTGSDSWVVDSGLNRVIEGSEWMSESARETAMSKLGGMLFEVESLGFRV